MAQVIGGSTEGGVQIANFNDIQGCSATFAVATGVANIYSATYSPAPTSIYNGLSLYVQIPINNTGPVTINVNLLGAVAIKKQGGLDLDAGDFIAGQIYHICAIDGYFQLLGGVTFLIDIGGSPEDLIDALGLGSAAYTDSTDYATATHDHDSDYAPITKGVTNGDTHNHVGGDGAAITEDALSLSDVTTANVSTSKHGLCPKAPNDTTKFLRGDGSWAQSSVPVGAVIAFPTGTPPDGFLELDGSSLSRSTYANLYALIGVTYGSVDGTHFTLPNYRGYFLRGWAHGLTTDPDRASRTNRGDGTTGDYVGTKQNFALLTHNHSLSMNVYASIGGSLSGVYAHERRGDCTPPSMVVNNYSGSSENRPININVMWCIKY